MAVLNAVLCSVRLVVFKTMAVLKLCSISEAASSTIYQRDIPTSSIEEHVGRSMHLRGFLGLLWSSVLSATVSSEIGGGTVDQTWLSNLARYDASSFRRG